jgi:fatty acid desaturase
MSAAVDTPASGLHVLERASLRSGAERGEMLEALVGFLILVIIVCVIAAIVLWAVQKFFPEIYPPARLIVGAVALIAILYALLRLIPTLNL